MNKKVAYEQIERMLNNGNLVATTTTDGPFKLTIDHVTRVSKAEHMGYGMFRGYIPAREGEVVFDAGGAMQRVEDAEGNWLWSFSLVSWESRYTNEVYAALGITIEQQLEILKGLREL